MISRRNLSLGAFFLIMIVGTILKVIQPDLGNEPAIEQTQTVSSTVVKTTPVPSQATSSTVVIRWPIAVSSSAQIVRVIDGDTVDVLPDGETKVVRIRLLGINTPESVDPRRPVQCFGKEASHIVKELLTGKRTALVPDPQGDDHDKYGRELRILVLEDATDVNASLVAQGYAHAYVDFPMKKERKTQLRFLETQARTEKRGLWNEQACNGEAYPAS